MNVLSLCSGAGGFDLGFEQAGMTIVAQCEIMPHARSVLAKHWPDVECHEDIRTFDATPLRGAVDIVIGGTPCQDLSVAGKRAGLSGARSGLWWEMVRIIDECQPALVVWENVPGAFSSNDGRDFAVILDSLADLGALDIAYRVCDAQYWGVPQRRRRVFVVADFAGERAGEILFEPGSSSRNTPPRRTPGQEVAGTIGGGSGSRGWSPDTDRMTFIPVGTPEAPDIAATLTRQNTTIDRGGFASGPVNYVIANALTATDYKHHDRGDGSANLVVAAVDFVNVTSKANGTRVEYGSPANTLHSRPQSVIGPTIGVRRLTPLEHERLMGWPDNHTATADTGKTISDSKRYQLIGNGVASPVARWLASRIFTVCAQRRAA